MAEVTMRRRFTAELSVRVEDLLSSARTRIKILAALTFIEFPVVGRLLDYLADPEAGVGLFAIVGGVVGLLAVLLILDWGRKLDHRPKAMNLIKARNGAIIMHLLLPFGPLVSWGLLKVLRHPTLVSYAVANHPDSGRLDDEEVLATVRVRSAYITMRRAGYTLAILAVLAAVAGSGTPEGDADAEARGRYFLSSIALAIIALGHLFNGFLGVGMLKEMTARRVKTMRKLTPLIWALFPFGTYAAWSTYEVELEGLPSGEPDEAGTDAPAPDEAEAEAEGEDKKGDDVKTDG